MIHENIGVSMTTGERFILLYPFVDKRAIFRTIYNGYFLCYSLFFNYGREDCASTIWVLSQWLAPRTFSFSCQVAGEQHWRHNSIATSKRNEKCSTGEENVSASFLLDIQELDHQQVSLVSG